MFRLYLPDNIVSATNYVNHSTILPTFIPVDEIHEKTQADTETWLLEDTDLLRAVPNANEVEIVVLKNSNQFKEVHDHLRQEKVIGLVVMGTKSATQTMVDRYTKPVAIVLTTSDKFYVIDPDDKLLVTFLKMKLVDSRLEFFTTDGLNEADCLWRHLGIDLRETRATDCAGVHIYMMQSMRNLCSAALDYYPREVKYKARGKTRIESFTRLVDIWMGLDCFALHNENREQLKLMRLKPKLNLTTRNLIMKRCLLVRPLAKTLKRYSELEAKIVSELNHRRLTAFYNEDKLVRETARRIYKTILSSETYKKHRQRMQFAHLDVAQFKLGSPARYYLED